MVHKTKNQAVDQSDACFQQNQAKTTVVFLKNTQSWLVYSLVFLAFVFCFVLIGGPIYTLPCTLLADMPTWVCMIKSSSEQQEHDHPDFSYSIFCPNFPCIAGLMVIEGRARWTLSHCPVLPIITCISLSPFDCSIWFLISSCIP